MVILQSSTVILVDGIFKFANYYQDHMVLQRAPQRSIVWGYMTTFSTPPILTLNQRVYHTTSSPSSGNSFDESIWSVTLDSQIEEGPFLKFMLLNHYPMEH